MLFYVVHVLASFLAHDSWLYNVIDWMSFCHLQFVCIAHTKIVASWKQHAIEKITIERVKRGEKSGTEGEVSRRFDGLMAKNHQASKW